MKSYIAKSTTIWLSIGAFCLVMQCIGFITAKSSYADEQMTGAFLFKKNCSGCHTDAKKIQPKKSIIEIMKNPPPYMPVFNEDRVSAEDARKIEAYILMLNK